MSSSTAQEYIKLFGDDPQARLALLACAAALRLDDETAYAAIELVAQSNGTTQGLLRRVKNLGCVWREGDGSWYVTEDVRPHLLERLHESVPETTLVSLRERLAADADSRAERLPHDGQIASYEKLLSKFEAAYQRVLIPDKTEQGAAEMAELWQHSPKDAARATARSVDYLAGEFDRRLHRLPNELLFLRGMAARSRGDRKGQERYFGKVWEAGRRGYIYAVAAHIYGLLIQYRDRETAERALKDSISWDVSGYGRAMKYHSLGNLLAKERDRWPEAEEAYEQSLKIDKDDESRAETLHSLGNLQAKGYRWREAEKNYRKSLSLRRDPEHQGQVYHSIGKLLFDLHDRRGEAEEAFELSLKMRKDALSQAQVLTTWADALSKLETEEDDRQAEAKALKALDLDRDNQRTVGICYRILTGIYERRGEYRQALNAAEGWKSSEEALGELDYAKTVQAKIDELRKKAQRQPKPKQRWWE